MLCDVGALQAWLRRNMAFGPQPTSRLLRAQHLWNRIDRDREKILLYQRGEDVVPGYSPL
jgi:hypothetical protein